MALPEWMSVRVLTLRAEVRVADALTALGRDLAWPVVVVSGSGDGRRVVVLGADVLRRGLPSRDPDQSLEEALGLANRTAATVVDLTREPLPSRPSPGTVLTEGDRVVGMVASRTPDRTTGAPPPPIWLDPPVDHVDLDLDLPTEAEPPLPDAGPPDAAGAEAEPEAGAEAEPEAGAEPAPTTSTGRFRAYPDVDGPAQVTAPSSFTVSVGFAREQAPGGDGPPVVLPGVGPEVDFEIQVSGFGFTFPDGATHQLTVSRDQPDRPDQRVEVRVVPDPVPVAITRSVEVSYNHGGALVGRAWCDVEIVPAPAGIAAQPAAPAEPAGPRAPSGGSGMPVTGTDLGPAPDLTVTVRTSPGHPEVSWTFQTPYDVPRPSDPVVRPLPQPTTEAFANQVLGQLPAGRGNPLLASEVRGLGSLVAGAFPTEFWHVLGEVWDRVGDRPPTLLLVLDEPYIPWELALVGRDQLPTRGAALEADGVPPLLGTLLHVGRWLNPRREPSGRDRPGCPPRSSADVPTMAVVPGAYTSGVGALPGAVAECGALATTYGALSVGIGLDAIDALLTDQLDRDGAPYHPAVVHFALHGAVSTGQQQFTGLMIGTNGASLLSPWAVEASPLAAHDHPFVFLNACQVGVESTALDALGGLPASFLRAGACGVVGPLWNVDDDLARDISTGFYRDVLDEGRTVGEALMRLRRHFGTTPVPTATPLAYVFYGHPSLQLRRVTGSDPAAAGPAAPAPQLEEPTP